MDPSRRPTFKRIANLLHDVRITLEELEEVAGVLVKEGVGGEEMVKGKKWKREEVEAEWQDRNGNFYVEGEREEEEEEELKEEENNKEEGKEAAQEKDELVKSRISTEVREGPSCSDSIPQTLEVPYDIDAEMDDSNIKMILHGEEKEEERKEDIVFGEATTAMTDSLVNQPSSIETHHEELPEVTAAQPLPSSVTGNEEDISDLQPTSDLPISASSVGLLSVLSSSVPYPSSSSSQCIDPSSFSSSSTHTTTATVPATTSPYYSPHTFALSPLSYLSKRQLLPLSPFNVLDMGLLELPVNAGVNGSEGGDNSGRSNGSSAAAPCSTSKEMGWYQTTTTTTTTTPTTLTVITTTTTTTILAPTTKTTDATVRRL